MDTHIYMAALNDILSTILPTVTYDSIRFWTDCLWCYLMIPPLKGHSLLFAFDTCNKMCQSFIAQSVCIGGTPEDSQSSPGNYTDGCTIQKCRKDGFTTFGFSKIDQRGRHSLVWPVWSMQTAFWSAVDMTSVPAFNQVLVS